DRVPHAVVVRQQRNANLISNWALLEADATAENPTWRVDVFETSRIEPTVVELERQSDREPVWCQRGRAIRLVDHRRADALPARAVERAQEGQIRCDALAHAEARAVGPPDRCDRSRARLAGDEASVNLLIEYRAISQADLRPRRRCERHARGPAGGPTMASEQPLSRNSRSRDAGRKHQVRLVILDLDTAADTQPVGDLDRDGRGAVVRPKRAALGVKGAGPPRTLEINRQSEWRVEREAKPDSIRQLHRGISRRDHRGVYAVRRAVCEAEGADGGEWGDKKGQGSDPRRLREQD